MAAETEKVLKAQNDREYLGEFIQSHENFIRRCITKTTHRFCSKSDDEWSIGMIAFLESIRGYDASKGNFFSFAQMVIRRRLLDYFQSEKRHEVEILVEPSVMEGEFDELSETMPIQNEILTKIAQSSPGQLSGGMSAPPGHGVVHDEIDAIHTQLMEYGFSFFDLPEHSPRWEKTRRECSSAVNTIVEDDKLFSDMRRKKVLPIAEICRRSDLKRKSIERHRRYIIAAAEILGGDYPILATYVN